MVSWWLSKLVCDPKCCSQCSKYAAMRKWWWWWFVVQVFGVFCNKLNEQEEVAQSVGSKRHPMAGQDTLPTIVMSIEESQTGAVCLMAPGRQALETEVVVQVGGGWSRDVEQEAWPGNRSPALQGRDFPGVVGPRTPGPAGRHPAITRSPGRRQPGDCCHRGRVPVTR